MKKLHKITLVTVASVVTLFSPAPVTYALNPADYVGQGIDHYDTRVTCAAGSGSLKGADNIEKIFNWLTSNGFNAAQASGILGNIQVESAGTYSPFQMQYSYASSGIETVLPFEGPGAVTAFHKALGIIQWDGGRRQALLKEIAALDTNYITTINTYGRNGDTAKKALEPDTIAINDSYLELELKFINKELEKSYKSVYSTIKAVPDTDAGAQDAAEEWVRHYEIPGNMEENVRNRRANASEFYAKYKDKAAGATGTTTATSANCGRTPAGSVVWYSQADPKWASTPYAGQTMKAVGCGPTSMAIILASLYDKTITPPDVAAVAGNQTNGTSSWGGLITGVNQKWGLSISTTPLSWSAAIDFVKSGKGYVWMGGSGDPPFTNSGHLVAMVGVSADGNSVTIADPWGGYTSSGKMHENIHDYPASQIQSQVGSGLFGVPKP